MLFFEDSLKELKKELKEVGADISYVKGWQKSFDKVKRQSVILEDQYKQAKVELEAVGAVLKDMEQFLIACKTNFVGAEIQKKLGSFSKELKVHQNSFDQEFLIGKEDKDFHLTYRTLLILCAKPLKEQKDVLILQSEVENLLAVITEALEKKWPDFRALAFFYIDHIDGELIDLPHVDKVEMVGRIYESEFLKSMRQILEASFGEARAKQILEVDLWN